MKHSPDEHDGSPAAPESETPEVDAALVGWHDEKMLVDLAHSLERRLSLAQTEIKRHMRVVDELRAEVANVTRLEFYWLEQAKMIGERYEQAQARCAAAYPSVSDASALEKRPAPLADELAAAQARIAELEKDAARWRKGVSDGEFPIRRSGQWMHVSRTSGRILTGETPEEVIDAIIKDRA